MQQKATGDFSQNATVCQITHNNKTRTPPVGANP